MENWKDIPGYEGLYQVSDQGRIRSLERERIQMGTKYISPGKVMSPCVRKKGYNRISLRKNNKAKSFLLHRLVLLAFVGEPMDDKVLGMHLNDNPRDNRLVNLKWGSPADNSKDAWDKGLYPPLPLQGKFNEDHPLSRPLIQMTMSGEFIKRFENSYDVLRQLKINQSNIIQVCKGRRNHAGGFKWAYAQDEISGDTKV